MMHLTSKEKQQARAFLYKRGLKPPHAFVVSFAETAKSERVSFGALFALIMSDPDKPPTLDSPQEG